MKNLNKYIQESILDDEDEIMDKMSDDILTTQFLKDNYEFKGCHYTIKNGVVDIIKDKNFSEIRLTNQNISTLTNGLFKFGTCESYFTASDCSIENVIGAPEILKAPLTLSGNQKLKSLKGCPVEVHGYCDISNCKNLESLDGCPDIVHGSFYLSGNLKLKSLKGGPSVVDEKYRCEKCKKILDFEGAPLKVGRDFIAKGCTIVCSIKGLPKEIGGKLDLTVCGRLYTTEEEIRNVCNVKKDIKLDEK